MKVYVLTLYWQHGEEHDIDGVFVDEATAKASQPTVIWELNKPTTPDELPSWHGRSAETNAYYDLDCYIVQGA